MTQVTEEQIAEKLGELEPAWAGKPNLFEKEIAAKDAKSLTAKLDDKTPAVRADAAEALGLLKEHSVTGKLKQLLNDGEPMVRRAAAVALVSTRRWPTSS
jgi:HEAT repeat protein